MIHNFFNTVQQDFTCLANRFNGTSPLNEETRKKVSLAAVRMFAVLGMTIAAVIGVKVFTAASVLGALFKLAMAVTLYAFSHDIFVIARNQEKGVVSQVASALGGFIADAKDLWNGNKDLNDTPRHPFSEGTLLRPLWDANFWENERRQLEEIFGN